MPPHYVKGRNNRSLLQCPPNTMPGSPLKSHHVFVILEDEFVIRHEDSEPFSKIFPGLPRSEVWTLRSVIVRVANITVPGFRILRSVRTDPNRARRTVKNDQCVLFPWRDSCFQVGRTRNQGRRGVKKIVDTIVRRWTEVLLHIQVLILVVKGGEPLFNFFRSLQEVPGIRENRRPSEEYGASRTYHPKYPRMPYGRTREMLDCESP